MVRIVLPSERRARGNTLYRRFYSSDYLPQVRRREKQWSGEKKLKEFIRREFVHDRKEHPLTHHGFFKWVLSRGAPKGWDDLSDAEQRKWADKIVGHLTSRHHERRPNAPIVLRDPLAVELETGKPRKFAFSVDQELEDLADMAHTMMDGLAYQMRQLDLSPRERRKWEVKWKRTANLYTIYVGIESMIDEGRTDFG